jgi:hypothetical protein
MDIPNSSPPAAAETLTLTALDGVTVTALRYAARRPVASGIAQARSHALPGLGTSGPGGSRRNGWMPPAERLKVALLWRIVGPLLVRLHGRDRKGYWLLLKRLEQDCFTWPAVDAVPTLTVAQLNFWLCQI